MQLLIFADHLSCTAGGHIRIIFRGFDDFEAGVIGHIVLEHIQNKTFLNGLPHTVNVERMKAAVLIFRAEQLQRLVLGRCGKGKERQILMPPLNGHFPHQAVVWVQLFFGLALDLGVFPQSILGIRKGGFQFQSRAAGLGGMGLVYDNRKVPSCYFIHFLIDDRELLQGGDDNAHTAVDGVPQVLGGLIFPDGLNGAEGVVKAGNGLLQLRIQHGAVGNDHHAGEHRRVLLIEQRGQPVSRPRNGVGLAASGAVLDQVIMPGSVLSDIGQQLPHHIQLMIARKNQRFAVLQVHKLLGNVHHTVLLKDILPQIRRRVAVWVCRIALAAVVSGSVGALVKGQEIGVLSGELCGHPHLGVIHAEIGQNALVELEAKLPRVAVIHPLPLGVIHRLSGVLVF